MKDNRARFKDERKRHHKAGTRLETNRKKKAGQNSGHVGEGHKERIGESEVTWREV